MTRGVDDFSVPSNLRSRGKCYGESKWKYLKLLAKIEIPEKVLLDLNAYWLEQMALAVHNNHLKSKPEYFPGEYIDYEDGRVITEDVLEFIKKYRPKLAKEFIGLKV